MKTLSVDRRTIATSATATGGTFTIQVANPRVALDDASVSSVSVLVKAEGESSERPSPPVAVLNSNTVQVALAPSCFGVNSTDGYNDEGIYQLSLKVVYTDGSQDIYEVEERLKIVDTLEEDL